MFSISKESSLKAAAPGLSNSAPRRGLWAGPTPQRAVEKPCGFTAGRRVIPREELVPAARRDAIRLLNSRSTCCPEDGADSDHSLLLINSQGAAEGLPCVTFCEF